MTTFEAYVLDVKEATYTVKNAANGAIYHNCKLCAMGVSDWCVSKDDYVLCTNTEHGRTYILGEIKGRAASTEGIRLGESDTDKFVVTQQATLIHQRDINTTIIDADGLEGFYKKVTIKGFGTAIECTEDSIVISVPGKISGESGIIITPTEIKLFGDASGGILKGKEAQEQIDALADKLNGLINKFLGHGHNSLGDSGAAIMTSTPFSGGIPTAAPGTYTIKSTESAIAKPNVQSTKVKSS
jgi:hypothetical protein